MDLMSDNASYSPPNLHAVNSAGILYTDWSTYAEPNLRELEKALISNETVKNMGKESIAQATGANESPWLSAFSGMSEVTAEYIAGFGKDRNPLLAYINAARHMLNAMDVMVITASLSKAGVKAVAGATFAAGNLLAGAANVLTGGALNASATAAASLLEDLFTVIMCVVVPLKAIFTFFAFIVPAIPLFCWIAAIVGWLVLTVEAVVAAPVWLVAHCMPEGEGFAGQHGRAGWTLFLSVLLRAPLLVLCMYLCMILIDASGSLISELFGAYLLASRSVSTTAQNFGLTASVALLIVLGTVIGLLTWKLFDLVTGLPDRILRWAGGLLQNLGDEGRGLAQQALGESRSSVENAAGMGRGVSKVLADRAEHNRKMRESQTGTGDARAKEEAEHGDHAIGSISKLREDDPLG
jgi:conjugal transfer/type IV secretion protein DotA/TraY